MPAVQKLYNSCKASLTPNGPISEEGLEKVRSLLGKRRKSSLVFCLFFRRIFMIMHLLRIVYGGTWYLPTKDLMKFFLDYECASLLFFYFLLTWDKKSKKKQNEYKIWNCLLILILFSLKKNGIC